METKQGNCYEYEKQAKISTQSCGAAAGPGQGGAALPPLRLSHRADILRVDRALCQISQSQETSA